jgi:hypothetical protein
MEGSAQGTLLRLLCFDDVVQDLLGCSASTFATVEWIYDSFMNTKRNGMRL